MKPNWLFRLRAFFGFEGKPHPDKSKEHDTVGSSTNPSRPRDESQRPQALTTEVDSVSVDPVTSSVAEPTASIQSGSLTFRSFTSREEVHVVTSRLFWNRAYEWLRHEDEQLVSTYEELLSRELLTDSQESDGPSDRIDNTDLEHRQEQLKTISSNGLQRMEDSKTRYKIFGHEFSPRDQAAQAGRFALDMKTLIDEAVKASPEASLVWAGVCTILPVLTNPVDAEEANREGFTYVTSRMGFYAELEHVLWPAGLGSATGLRRKVESELVGIYRHILEFQLRTVLRFYQTRLKRYRGDVFNSGVWKDIVSKIHEKERIFDGDLKKINDTSLGKELENLNKKADQFLVQMSSILSNLLEAQRHPTSSSFNNYGGHQYNATGWSTQNINSGSGPQFNGSRFSAPVHINGRGSGAKDYA